MELEDLKNLIELLKETDITELQVEKDGTKVKIRREKFFQSLDLPSPKAMPAIQETIVKEIVAEDSEQRLITICWRSIGH